MAEKRRRRRTNRSAREIREIVEDWKRSGLSQNAFAKSRGLHPSVLGRWVRKTRSEAEHSGAGSENRVVPVRLVSRESANSGSDDSGVEIQIREIATIRLRRDFDAGALSRALAALEASC